MTSDSNRLGNIIGLVKRTFSTKLDNGEKVQLTVTFDFTTASDDDIRNWLASERTIAFQRPLRKLTRAEAESLNGSTILAESAGRKLVSKNDQIKALMAAGLDRETAELILDRPDLVKRALQGE